jgi:hypothetical protein
MKIKTTIVIFLFTLYLMTSSKVNAIGLSNCTPPSASVYIDINNVRAMLLNGGDMWWDVLSTGMSAYEIPKGSGLNTAYASSLWISALDYGGNIHTASQTYRQRGYDFWPGPLNNFGETDSITCKTWDRMFSVKGKAIVNAKIGIGIDSTITNWPGGIGMAPFVDIDGDGVYEPNGGEYPIYDFNIQSNIPGEMVWWVMNDVGNTHTAFPGGLPMGIEIQVTAFAYSSSASQAINNSTMYRYKIVNKSSSPLYDVSAGHFMDPDLGDGNDDYVGCNTSIQGRLFYCYNAEAVDTKYGNKPPAIGLTYLRTFKDENGNSLPPSSFMFFTNQGQSGINADPSNAIELNRYLHAKWADGMNLTYGTPTGRGGTVNTNFAFPGNIYNQNSWIETDAPGDRRMVPSIGPFTLQPGAVNEVVFAMVWAQSDTGANKGSVAKLILSADSVRSAASTNFASYTTGIERNDKFSFSIHPNPVINNCVIELPFKSNELILVKIYNVQGKIVSVQKFDPITKVEINLNNIEPGIFLIQVNQEKKSSTQKIIKQ